MKNEIHQLEQAKFYNALFETTNTQTGLAVPRAVGMEVADAMKTFSAMRRASTVIVTPTGGGMGWPNSDGRAEEGEQLEQNAASTSLDPSFGSADLPVFKYGSKLIRVPMELYQDAGADFFGFMNHRIAARIGRITNRKFTTGAGTSEPTGIVTVAPIGRTGATGQTVTVIYDDLEGLIISVDEAYRQNPKCAWMMHEQTLLFIRKMNDSAGHPLRLAARGENGQDRLLGYPVHINNDMPVMTANAKSILFGDFGTYIVRDTLMSDVRRMTDSVFATAGQIGFIGFTRSGGSYVDVGGAIKAYRNSLS